MESIEALYLVVAASAGMEVEPSLLAEARGELVRHAKQHVMQHAAPTWQDIIQRLKAVDVEVNRITYQQVAAGVGVASKEKVSRELRRELGNALEEIARLIHVARCDGL